MEVPVVRTGAGGAEDGGAPGHEQQAGSQDTDVDRCDEAPPRQCAPRSDGRRHPPARLTSGIDGEAATRSAVLNRQVLTDPLIGFMKIAASREIANVSSA